MFFFFDGRVEPDPILLASLSPSNEIAYGYRSVNNISIDLMEDEVDQDDVELANPDLFYEVGDVFTKLGYKLLEYHPIRFFTLVDNPFDVITAFFKKERQALLFKRRGFVNAIFSHENEMYHIVVKDIRLISGFFNAERLKNKKRCKICCERRSKCFKQCCRCLNSICSSCHKKKKTTNCSFCRFNLIDHIVNQCKELEYRQKDILRISLE